MPFHGHEWMARLLMCTGKMPDAHVARISSPLPCVAFSPLIATRFAKNGNSGSSGPEIHTLHLRIGGSGVVGAIVNGSNPGPPN
jgi:hypothetical protein